MNARFAILRAMLLGLVLGIVILFTTILLQGCHYAERCARLCTIQGLVIDTLRMDEEGIYTCRCTSLEKLIEKRERERRK